MFLSFREVNIHWEADFMSDKTMMFTVKDTDTELRDTLATVYYALKE